MLSMSLILTRYGSFEIFMVLVLYPIRRTPASNT
jgi:hypothetical protein